ncbi:hypothetical protein EVAR_6226_1 [Eumeta japonica]|uniref:HAT C-terminal dimerisation domain-containing protein n=1 Tax=Eumeta variegata TaxID=151549 RepID=A0A4C1T944_EUMVA|nr:hypothetical protein EVAR_6226_1 [Eumeta japonica]
MRTFLISKFTTPESNGNTRKRFQRRPAPTRRPSAQLEAPLPHWALWARAQGPVIEWGPLVPARLPNDNRYLVDLKKEKALHQKEVIEKLPKLTSYFTTTTGETSRTNASNMSGKYSGLQTRIKEKCEFATFVPCAGHSLNLVGVHAAGCVPEASQFFEIVQKVYNFFSGSTHRWNMLTEHLGSKKVVKSLSQTRWSARADAVSALHGGYKRIIEALITIANDTEQARETGDDALRINLVTSNHPPKKETRNLTTRTYLKEQDVEAHVRVFDGSAPSVQLNGKERFNVETFLPIIDTLSVHLKQRLSSYETSENEAPNGEQEVYNLLKQNKIEDTFPNVEIALRIFLSMMVTNCSGERSFSKLKRIKNELRSTMLQERLTSLSLMSIECDILNTIDFEEVINDFAHFKSRRVPLQST